MAFTGAVAFSGKAIVAKLLYRQGIDAVAALALRMLLAWPFFIAMAWWGGRGKSRLQGRDRLRVGLLGFTGYSVLPMWMVMRAMELIGSAHTAQVGMIGPVSTVMLAVWLLGERFTLPLLLGTVLVLVGVALLARQKPPTVIESS